MIRGDAMLPAVRMVCGECLRSIELAPDVLGRMPTSCPVCGGTVDSRRSSFDTPDSNFTVPMGNDPVTPGENHWRETFAKGTLGTIGRFQLRELLGDGGFGVVYQAYDPRLDRDVALKVLKENNPGERVMQRFFREARAASRLKHPNIVRVHDSGCEGGRCWIAYEFVDGRTLSRVAASEPFTVVKSVVIAHELAGAIEHAHSLGVFHRDLKPANVMIDAHGHAHLIDFGLARRGDVDSDLTRDGAILGTPKYMAPEQANGESRTADERSDVYSLGVILFELLTGQRPIDVPSSLPAWKVKPSATQPPPSLRTINKDIPVALDRVVLKALAVDPKDRYPSARAFKDALKGWMDSRKQLPVVSVTLLSGLVSLAACVVLLMFPTPYVQRQFGPGDGAKRTTDLESAGTPPSIRKTPLDAPRLEASSLLVDEEFGPETTLYRLASGDGRLRYHLSPTCYTLQKRVPERFKLDEVLYNNPQFEPSHEICEVCLGKERAAKAVTARKAPPP